MDVCARGPSERARERVAVVVCCALAAGWLVHEAREREKDGVRESERERWRRGERAREVRR